MLRSRNSPGVSTDRRTLAACVDQLTQRRCTKHTRRAILDNLTFQWKPLASNGFGQPVREPESPTAGGERIAARASFDSSSFLQAEPDYATNLDRDVLQPRVRNRPSGWCAGFNRQRRLR